MTHLSDTVCPLCGGHKQASATTFSADNGTSLVVVRDVKNEQTTVDPFGARMTSSFIVSGGRNRSLA